MRIRVPATYGLHYPITKMAGPWLVVGVTCFADHDPRRRECGPIHSIDIHLDADDPNFPFADLKDWRELDASLIEQYNLPHRRSVRLARRRATEFSDNGIDDNADRAKAYMQMTMKRREKPHRPVFAAVRRWMIGFYPAERS